MRLNKKVKDLTWMDYQSPGNNRIHFSVFFRWPVIDHEKLLCIDFQRNRESRSWYASGNDFRIVLSKKHQTVRVLYKGERRTRRLMLHELLYGYGCSAKTCYPQISEKDELALKQWLGLKSVSINHCMPELEEWIRNAINKEVLAENDARGEIRDEDVALCPDELPDGFVDYIRRWILPEDKVLLYKKGNVRGRCFACGQEVRAISPQRFRQTELTRCPNCGKTVRAYLETSDQFKVNYVDNIASIQVGKDGKTVFFRLWHLIRDSSAQWENLEGQLQEVARYAIRGNRVAKWQLEAKHNYFMNTWRESYADWTRYRDVTKIYDGCYEFYLPPDWRYQLEDTSLRYIELREYLDDRNGYAYRNIIRFAVDWARYPAVEKLWKAGYHTLIHIRIAGMSKNCRIRWQEATIQKATGIPLGYLKKRAPVDWDADLLSKTKQLIDEANKGTIKESEIGLLQNHEIEIKQIRRALGHASVKKILDYLDKQVAVLKEVDDLAAAQAKAEHRHYCRNHYIARELYDTYRDYLQDCEQLNLDLNDRGVLFPNNLDLAHTRTIAQVKHQASKEKTAAFKRQSKKLEKLCMEKGGLIIRPAKSATELIAEGKYLHHCVGGYADRMAKGVVAIMLIRRVEDPDTPYYTLEWTDNRVVQCRTMRNEDYRKNPQVESFVNAWVRWVQGGCKKKKSTKVA